MAKTYVLEARQIRALAPGHGACVASDKITVHGELVGYMYREPPVDTSDSGWRFLAGTETQEFMDDPMNQGVFDVNTIANYDTDIIEYLDEPIGAAFVREPLGSPFRAFLEPDPETQFVQAPMVVPAPPAVPVVADVPADVPMPVITKRTPPPVRRPITPEWSIDLDPSFEARLVEGDLQFVSPGPPVRTVWVSVWGFPDEPTAADTPEAVLEEFRSQANPAAYRRFDEPGGDANEHRFGTWYPETVDERQQWSLYGYTVRPDGWVQTAFIADQAEDLQWALDAWRSLSFTPPR